MSDQQQGAPVGAGGDQVATLDALRADIFRLEAKIDQVSDLLGEQLAQGGTIHWGQVGAVLWALYRIGVSVADLVARRSAGVAALGQRLQTYQGADPREILATGMGDLRGQLERLDYALVNEAHAIRTRGAVQWSRPGALVQIQGDVQAAQQALDALAVPNGQ